MRAARLIALVLVGLGVVAYSAWPLEFLFATGVSPLHDPVGELLTRHPVFRVAQIVSGSAFLLVGPPLVRLAPVHWTGRLTAGSVSVFGALVFADAAYPGNTAVSLLTNVTFVVGSCSLVLWWPRGWRESAIIGLALIVLTWLAVLVTGSLGPGHFAGVATRAQLVVRAAQMVLGAMYVFRVTPAPRYASRVG
ncbi:hypothetical protein ACFWY9_43460 [Amycolatopsis sp. NPDC059027]|uniref:hypothetical protein n=1 Tax=unclassified Amycolatopsis TaxID=2618356 RepID=UPI00366D82AE